MSISITDANGGVPHFTQWDVDRELIISGVTVKPMVHFGNAELKRAIVVESEADGNNWRCKVPNFILQFPCIFFVTVFCQEDGGEGLAVYRTRYKPVPRMKPQDYTYEENIGYINWTVKAAEAQDLLDGIADLRAEIAEAAEAADDARDQAVSAAENIDATVAASLEAAKASGIFDGADGEDGEDGAPGADGAKGDNGISPRITVTDIQGGHNIAISDAYGDYSIDVMDGATGSQGSQGQPGTPGYSPTVSVADISGGHRVTITDASGSHAFDVMDGQGGGISPEIVSIPESSFGDDPVYHDYVGFDFGSGGTVLTPKANSDGIIDPYILPLASQSKKGAMSAADKAKLDAIGTSVKYAGAATAGGPANKAASIPMGHLDSTSTSTVMTAQVDGITELRDGVCMWLENGVVASASGVTLNINGLGAKPIYNSLSGAVVTTTFTAASTYLFVYNATRVTGGCWDMVYGYDANTTYTPVKMGFGYATCSTAEATAAKTAALSSYTLTTGGIVEVKFTNAVPAGATLNINSKGAKAIYYKGAAITAGVIKAGDTVTMIYSTYYHVLSIDRWGSDIADLEDRLDSLLNASGVSF